MLDKLLEEAEAAESADFGLDGEVRGRLSLIVDLACSGRNRSALAVTLTLALKKHLCPEQDIRKHQASMDGGFSGRGLDQRKVTPFLRSENFPFMQSGSGWLTRSFEQPEPYNLSYPGKIQPPELKKAFLRAVDDIENQRLSPKTCMLYMLRRLSDWRSGHASLKLARPTGKTIHDIVNMIKEHWSESGSSKLPVIAIHATYSRLIEEVRKYRGCTLLPLRSHTAPDSRGGRIGDIEVCKEGAPFESVEIKHGVVINYSLVAGLEEKISTSGTNTYYILSTNEEMKDFKKISSEIMRIRRLHGCQVIPNGVANTLKYYLRLLSNTDAFIRAYVDCIEADDEISFELRRKWNDIVNDAQN